MIAFEAYRDLWRAGLLRHAVDKTVGTVVYENFGTTHRAFLEGDIEDVYWNHQHTGTPVTDGRGDVMDRAFVGAAASLYRQRHETRSRRSLSAEFDCEAMLVKSGDHKSFIYPRSKFAEPRFGFTENILIC